MTSTATTIKIDIAHALRATDGHRPTYIVSSSDSDVAARARAITVEAWPVTVWRRPRHVRIGWLTIITEDSRWVGEGRTQTAEFHAGRDRPAMHRWVGHQFGDPSECEQTAEPIKAYAIPNVYRYAQTVAE